MKKIIILCVITLSLTAGTLWAGKATYKVVCKTEDNKTLKYGNDYSKLKKWSDNHNTGRGHDSSVTYN